MGQTNVRPSPIDILTADDLLKIFSFLNLIDRIRSRRVCTIWHYLLKHPTIWTHIDVTCYKRLADRILWSNALELQQCIKQHESVALEFLEAYASPSTRYVHLGELVNNDILLHLRDSCPHLKRIKLTKLVGKFPNTKLWFLPRNLQIISLRLISFREKHSQARISSHMRDFVVEPFVSLRYLCLDGATISSELCKQLCLSTELSTLRLQSCVFHTSMTEAFDNLTTKLTKLKDINLAFCRFYTDDVLERILRSIALNLIHSEHYGFHCLQPANSIKFDGFLKFVNTPGSLLRLNLSGIQGITPRVFGAFLKRNPNIENLHLRFCRTINDETLLSIVANLKHLKELKLSGCREITKSGVRLLAHHPCLEVLEIAEMNIALEAILYVVRLLPNITHLVLSPGAFKVCTKVLRREKPKLVVLLAKLDYQEYLERF